jgi:peptide/nickel transport system permease protein
MALASGIFLAALLFACFPGAKLYELAVGHGPNDLFPYAVSTSLRPAGPLTVTWATGQTAPSDEFSLTRKAPPKGTPKTFLLLGADSQLGRDEFLRVLYGGRVTLEVAIGAAFLAVLIGFVLGSVAGFFGSWVDAGVSRFTDLMMAFPVLLFLIMLGAVLEHGLTQWTFGGVLNEGVFQLVVLIAAFTWFYPARLVRTQVMSLRRREFVEAAEMVGARSGWIMRRHLLPHVIPPLIAYSAILVATNIMLEVGVSFLNAGIKLPTASWGSLLGQTWGSIINPNPYNPATVQPWLTISPSLAIFLTVFALNQFGEGLREAIDPRGAR